MPRTKLDKPKTSPDIDWLKAVMLERKQALKVTSEELSHAAKISDGYMRKLLSQKHTNAWPLDVRKAVCNELGIEVKTTLSGLADGELRIG